METNKPKINPRPTWLEAAIAVAVLSFISLAAVPRLSKAAGEGRMTELSDTLNVIRCTLDIYKAEHKGLCPGQRKAGTAVSPSDFIRDITMPSLDGKYRYFKKFPDNPFMAEAERRNTITFVNDPNIQPAGTEGTAWWFNLATNEFRACDNKFHSEY